MKLHSVLKQLKSAVSLIAVGILMILLHIKFGWLTLFVGIGWLVLIIKKFKK